MSPCALVSIASVSIAFSLRLREPVCSFSIASFVSIAPFRVRAIFHSYEPVCSVSIASSRLDCVLLRFREPVCSFSIASVSSLHCVALALHLRISSRFSIASRLRIAFPFVAFRRAFHRVSSRSRPHTPLYPTTLTREALRLAPLRQTPADTARCWFWVYSTLRSL